MKGLIKQPNSNRRLSKRFKLLNKIHFSEFNKKLIINASGLRRMPYDIHDLQATTDNFVYRAVINENESPFNSISRIRYNPNPSYMSRANIVGQGIAYYACDLDISVIEACRDKLRSSSERTFHLTVSKWKILKQIAVQIICNSEKAQLAGTDLYEYCLATKNKRKKELIQSRYRTYILKAKFIADQYAKDNIVREQDYLISAIHSNTLLKSEIIDGIIYPSVGYLYKGFNYVFNPSLFDTSFFQIKEVACIKVQFKEDISKYPIIEIQKVTNRINGDTIIW